MTQLQGERVDGRGHEMEAVRSARPRVGIWTNALLDAGQGTSPDFRVRWPRVGEVRGERGRGGCGLAGAKGNNGASAHGLRHSVRPFFMSCTIH
jgi:hypothetical protein